MLASREPGSLCSARILAAVCAVCATAIISCSGGLKSIKGDDQVFLEPKFWDRAEAAFGDYGGGWWLREKNTTIRYEGGNWYTTEDHHYQLVVLDAVKMERYANVAIPFGPTSRIVTLKARTIKSSGEVAPVSSGDIYERARIPGFMLYADTKSKVFAMPAFSDRCIIDLVYTTEAEAIYFQDDVEFGDRLPAKRAVYSYTMATAIQEAGFRIFYKVYNWSARPEETCFETTLGKMARSTWVAQDVTAYPEEPWSPPTERFIPRIVLAGFAPNEESSDWNGFTEWYSEMVPWLGKAMPAVADIADRATQGATGTAAMVQGITDYMGENVRYVSVGIKDSGLKPHMPAEVLENQYGDCKDMSCAVVMMLREKGIDARPALLLTRDAGITDTMLAAPRFNHMIVYVKTEDGDMWVDPTAAPCPATYLPYADRDVDVLVIKGKSGSWKHTPATTPFVSSRTSVTTVSVDPAGPIHGRALITYSGDLGFGLKNRLAGKSAGDLSRAVEEEVRDCLSDVTLDSCRVDAIDQSLPTVSLTCGFEKPSAAFQVESRLVVRLDFLRSMATELSAIPEGSGRTYPLWFPAGWEEADTVRIVIPPGWSVDRLPTEMKSENRYGSYGVNSFEDAGTVVIVAKYGLSSGEVPRSQFRDFTSFWAGARDGLGQEIVFKRM